MPDKKDVSSPLVVVANTLTKKQTQKHNRMTQKPRERDKRLSHRHRIKGYTRTQVQMQCAGRQTGKKTTHDVILKLFYECPKL